MAVGEGTVVLFYLGLYKRARVRMRDLVLTATLSDAAKKWQFPISNNNLGPGDARCLPAARLVCRNKCC